MQLEKALQDSGGVARQTWNCCIVPPPAGHQQVVG